LKTREKKSVFVMVRLYRRTCAGIQTDNRIPPSRDFGM
jgi:hypothetical protein